MIDFILAVINLDLIFILLGAFVAYLLGSVPTAIWTSKLYFGIDIRETR